MNVHDRTPILCELKLKEDKDAFYALIQLLDAGGLRTHTKPTRTALPLRITSRPCFAEAVPGKPARADLYILLHKPPRTGHHPETRNTAIALSRAIAKHPAIRAVIRRISWLEMRKPIHQAWI